MDKAEIRVVESGASTEKIRGGAHTSQFAGLDPLLRNPMAAPKFSRRDYRSRITVQ